MNEKNTALFNELGVDIPAAMERFMNNEELYLKFLGKFTVNEQIQELQDNIALGNKKDTLMTSHNLKSLTGNLSLIKLHELFCTQVADIRGDNWDAAVAIMDDIVREYERVVRIIKDAGVTVEA